MGLPLSRTADTADAMIIDEASFGKSEFIELKDKRSHREAR